MIAHFIITSAIASLALLGNGATAAAMPNEAANLDARANTGINVEVVCNVQHGAGFHAKTTGKGCDDWICVRGDEKLGINLDEWCRASYGSGAYASCSNGVFSWVCNH